MSAETSNTPLTPLQNAVYLLRQAQAKLAAYEAARAEPIAIVGLGCRFPGSEGPSAYWNLLTAGGNAITEVPPDRWRIDEYYDPDNSVPGKMVTRWGGFLSRVDEFDADFFGISPREAVRVDPQHRVLLEVAWEALEDAGIPPALLGNSSAGVYVGVIGSDYALLQSQDLTDMDVFSGTGSSHAILANRLSYVLNLHGPSIALDTACSSSLVTVDLACKALRSREIDLGLAAGVNLILGPAMTLALSKAHMMSPDGRCKAFDASADGYVRGEGCGVVVLKRLSDAVAQGDRILAVVRGTAVNHDGRSNGLSAPSGPAQEAVLRAALADARLSPRDIDYIEAHGTGTRLGDPIEIEALLNVLGAGRDPQHPLIVSSVKTNIGHLESAAGIAGLAKVIMMMRRGKIPPHLHLEKVNPLLATEGSTIEIPLELRDWPETGAPRRAGVSSFGFGGTNAHVIIEQAPAPTQVHNEVDRPKHLITLSARTPQALVDLATRYTDDLVGEEGEVLADMAFTANTGRSHFAHRAAVVGETIDDVKAKLKSLISGASANGLHSGVVEHDRAPKIAFLFTGQGAQYAGMGRQLYETQPTFRQAIDHCAAHLDQLLDRPLVSLLSADVGTALDQTGYTQPVMFAVEYALATLWRSWGVEPTAVMGHSVGEFAAACVAGVYSLADAARLIATRARLMQSLPAGGQMAAIMATPERVADLLAEASQALDIAAFNGPESVVISGAEAAVRVVLDRCQAAGIKAKPLATSHAFHSYLMDPILAPLAEVAGSMTTNAPQLAVISNLTGSVADASTYAAPDYWTRHARSPVRFFEGMKALADLGCELFLEIGPNPTLIGMGRRCIDRTGWKWLPSLWAGRDEWQTMLDSLGELYASGVSIDWVGYDRDYQRRRAPLPTYPFQRKRYWTKQTEMSSTPRLGSNRRSTDKPHPLVGERLLAAISEQVFEAQVTASRPSMLSDHKIQNVVVMPGAAYVEMGLAASAALHGEPWMLRDLSLVEPLVLGPRPSLVQTVIAAESAQAASFRVVSLNPGETEAPEFRTHALGRLEKPSGEVPPAFNLNDCEIRKSGEVFDAAWHAEALHKSGLQPGPTFQWFTRHWLLNGQALGELRPAREADRLDDYRIHPGMLDCAFQLLGAILPGAGTGIDAYVPMSIGKLRMLRPAATVAWHLATLQSLDRDKAIGTVQMFDADGNVVVELEGLQLRRVPRDWIARLVAEPQPDWLYELAWLRSARADDATPPATTAAGSWLVFDSADGLGAALVDRLEMKSQTCRLVVASTAEERRAAAKEFAASADPAPQGVIYLAGTDAKNNDAGEPDFEAARAGGWGGVLDVVHGVLESGVARPPRLWVVTRGAQAVGDTPRPLALAQAPLWGLGRVIASEHPELSCTRIDLDPDGHAEEIDALMDEVYLGGTEDQIAYRRGERFVSRLRSLRRKASGELALPKGQPYRLEIIARGQLDQVELRANERRAPGPGEVEIKVATTGLNFRDVLNVLDLYPGDPGPLGGECAGEVVAVGPGVEHLKPGDQVLALAPASFANYAITLSDFVVARPDSLNPAEAATVPICFLTCWYALHDLAKLQKGERLLIHAASGGVGLAAIQMARLFGAEIYATAGSERKRDYLRSLGIKHVFDSRSTDFSEQILAATNGEGVDAVLNSLTGETIGASLSVLRAGGRFLELGKTDLWDQTRVDAFRPGLKFFAIALDHMMADEPATIRRLFADLMPHFANGDFEALPLRTYPIQKIVDALRHMARAEHIGKVVIEATEGAADRLWLRDDGAYLVTGGLGGLGLKLARWLAEHGARHLVLTGRSAPNDEARFALDEQTKGGVTVDVQRCDVGRRDSVDALITAVEASGRPLRGIFHLAGVLDDGVLREQSRERFDRVLAAKALGGWYLHERTRSQPLDHFVLFSSAASMMGSPGQGNYASANALLDALAHHRRAVRLPALSINWGSWAEVGMAARLKESQGSRWAEAGIGWIEPDQGMRTLEELMLGNDAQAGVLPMNWPRFFARIPVGAEPAWLSDLAAQARQASGPTDSGPPALLEQLNAVTPGERFETATAFLRRQAGQVLAMDENSLPDARRPLNELGFDSLTGVEFCNRVSRAIGHTLNPTLLFEYPTLESIAGYVVRDLLKLECTATTAAVASEARATPETAASEATVAEAAVVSEEQLEQVEGMSDADMDALIMAQLQRLDLSDSTGAGPASTADPAV